MKFVNNAFSQKMLRDGAIVKFDRISRVKFMQESHRKNVVSCIGHQDTAKMFNLKFNRTNIKLDKGDVLFVCELNSNVDGRLPEGICRINELPNGFKFKFWKITVL